MLDLSEEDLGVGRTILVFHKSRRVPVDKDKLKRYTKGNKIT